MGPLEIYDFIKQAGVVGLLILIVVALIYHIRVNMVDKFAYTQQSADLQQVRADMSRLIGPALDRLATLQEKQLSLQEEMWRRLESHTESLATLSQDVKLISHELNMRRVEAPRDWAMSEYDAEEGAA